jgi:hypothetical protein
VNGQTGWIVVKDDIGKLRFRWALGGFEHVEIFISGGGESCVVCPIETNKGLPHYLAVHNWQHIPHLIKRLDAAGCVAVGLSQAAREFR